MEKIKELSKRIIEYSLDVQSGEKILIYYYSDECLYMVKELIDIIISKGAAANYKKLNKTLDSMLLKKDNDIIVEVLSDDLKHEIEKYDGFIYMKYNENEYEYKMASHNMKLNLGIQNRPYNNIRINNKKWIIFNYPSIVDSIIAKMPYDEYKAYAFNVMNVEYDKMYDKMLPLKELMEKTNEVRIIGNNTDISFSIKDMPAIICCGKNNIPDGEVYIAPIKDSVNGIITYNTPSTYRGNCFNNISLKFENGKIIEVNCLENNDELKKIIYADEGSCYIGEFSFGLNSKILYPINDILYDEKIKGSIHLTPGNAYANCDNGNRSSIHWDLVLIQREEYGGGEIYFDGTLIRKDGLFVIDSLQELNNM